MTNLYMESLFIVTGLYILMAWSMYLPLSGGLLFSGQPALVSIGAYTAVLLTTRSGVVFPAAVLCGGLVAALVAIPLGLLGIRLASFSLAIVSIGFFEILQVIFLNLEFVGRAQGLRGIPAFTGLPEVWISVLVIGFSISRLDRSRIGRQRLALGTDEVAAQCLGVSAWRSKILTIAIAGFIAGIAGGLYAHYLGYINPTLFGFDLLLLMFSMVIVGGQKTFWGPVLGAALLWLTPEVISFLQQWRLLFYGLLLILFLLFRPKGLLTRRGVGSWSRRLSAIAGRLKGSSSSEEEGSVLQA